MTLIDQLLTTVDAYCAAAELAESTVAGRIFNDRKKFTLLRNGADLSTRQHAKAMRWLSASFPAGAAWPEGVERPDPITTDDAA